jgi:type IV pilus assembly protein PilC
MPTFEYKAFAVDDMSRPIEDELDASSQAEAASIIRSQGMIAVNIKVKAGNKVNLTNLNSIFQKVKTNELAHFTRQLSTMIRAGMSPLQALDVVERGAKNTVLKRGISEIKRDINAGVAISTAFEKHPKIFTDLYVSLIRAGEIGGVMPEILDRLATQLERDAQLKREVRGAMIYPVVVITFAIGILTAMLIFVVPAFQTIFESAGGELPALTQVLVDLSSIMQRFWYLLPLALFGTFYGIKTALKSPQIRYIWDSFKLKAPMKIGVLVQKIVTARFARTLSTLQESGVAILASLEITGPITNNTVTKQAIERVAEDVKQGEVLSVCLRNQNVLPDMALSMLEAGEEAGEVNQMLAKVADTYEAEVSEAIKNMKTILEPLMIIIIGAIVGLTVVALYLPIFKVYDQIK